MPKVVKNLSGMLSAASEAVKLTSEITSESNEDHLKSTPTVGILTLNRQQVLVIIEKQKLGISLVLNLCTEIRLSLKQLKVYVSFVFSIT